MTIQLTPVQILAAIGILLALALVWRTSAHTTRKAAETARAGARLMSLTGRVVLTAAVIVGVQWVVITQPTDVGLRLVALGLPALFASYSLTRALTMTTVDTPHRRSGRR